MFLLDVEFELYTPRDRRCHSELTWGQHMRIGSFINRSLTPSSNLRGLKSVIQTTTTKTPRTLVPDQNWLETTPRPVDELESDQKIPSLLLELTERTNFKAGIFRTILLGTTKSDVDVHLGSSSRISDASRGRSGVVGLASAHLARH
jgi:hypothetical protein